MKTKITCTLILFAIFSCKKAEDETYKEALTQSIQNKITRELKQDNSSLKSIQLVKFDTLKEWQEADILLQYSNYRLKCLNKQQQHLTKELDNVKNMEDLEVINSKYAKVSDSIKYDTKIGESVRYLSPKDYKTGNYQAVFLLKIIDRKSNTFKKDSLFIYTNEKKEIFTQAQFIEQCINKFEKK